MLKEIMTVEELCVRVLGDSFTWIESDNLPCEMAFECEGHFFMLSFVSKPIAASLKAYSDSEQDYVNAFGVEVLRVGNRLQVVGTELNKRTLLAIRKALRYVH